MSDVLIDQDTMEDIGDSIRSKLGVQTTYLPSEMPSAIMSISGGGSGGSAKYSETVLWSGAQSATGTITLSESVKNFSIIMLMISTHPSNTNYYKTPWYILVSEITDYTTTYQFEPFGVRGAENVNDRACMLSLHFANETSISIDEVSHGSQAKATLLKVIGIKWETMQTALIYSEEEREIGVWTDGKPLYSKTVSFAVTVGNGYTRYTHNIANITPIAVEGEIHSSTDDIIYTIGANAAAHLSFGFSTDTVYLYQTSNYFNGWNARATLYYTKTTDQPGSGIWTTTGEYAHHYSTTEHVVGTWIDGKTIYEKTFELSSAVGISNTSWTSVTGVSVSNLSKFIGATCMSDMGTHYYLNAFNDNGTLKFLACRDNNGASALYLTIQYTKTT